MALPIIAEILDYHVEREGVEVEVHTENGWLDIREVIEPVEKLLGEIIDICNKEALDITNEEVSQKTWGRSSLAHEILRLTAKRDAETEA